MPAASNDPDFLGLILENKGIILKICHLYCPDRQAREDLTQEIIYQLWRSGKSYNREHRFSTWMYRVALNVAISFYRGGRKQIHALPLLSFHLEIEDDPDEGEVYKERALWLQACIKELKEFDRALILLYFEEKSYKEISEVLGISETNVATRISRIKERLRQCILNHQK
ncbi:MAG: sigma-70 family RNA polymerase sigma factor [Chitinophagaceae bacterium]|nr:sigma-70 family RNA polymerase sigma factor [Chitinophagaceae bacterium]